MKRMCRNCKRSAHRGWGGMIEHCLDYEMACSEAEEIEAAKNCKAYVEGTPDCYEDDDYCPSSTYGDYSPGNPWDAPGMSIKDFI